ncbi:MAG: hypothetical protein Q9217_006164 [Psora testacea]
MASLAGKVVVITGAGSGIGKATATLLAQHSVLLSLADVNATALEAVRADLQHHSPFPPFTTLVDVRSQTDCQSWIANTVAHFGQPITGAVNLAGVFGPSIAQERGAIRNITDAEFDHVWDVNVKGTLNCLRAQLPHMQEGCGGRDGGAIVNAASISGIVGVEYNGPYVASKHAIVGMTRTLAKEEGSKAIRVNAIAPGIIATPMIKGIEEAKGSTELFGAGDPGALTRKGDAEEADRSELAPIVYAQRQSAPLAWNLGGSVRGKVEKLEEKMDDLVALLQSSASGTPVNLNLVSINSTVEAGTRSLIDDSSVPNDIRYGGYALNKPLRPEQNLLDSVLTPAASSSSDSASRNPLFLVHPALEPSPEDAESYLNIFRFVLVEYLPFVAISPSTTAYQLRQESPFLWLSIMTVASTRLTQRIVLSNRVREIFGQEAFLEGTRNLDLLQAVLVYAAW